MRFSVTFIVSVLISATMAGAKTTTYQYGPNVLQTYNVYIPSSSGNGSASAGKYWLVWIHGGFYRDLAQNSTGVNAAIASLEANSSDIVANQVAGIASLNYRLSALPGVQPNNTPSNELQNARWPDHLNDAVAALKDLNKHYPIDGNYVLSGHSVGAQISYLAALETLQDPSVPKPAVVLGISGIYDYPQLHITNPSYDYLVLNAMREDQLVEASPSEVGAEKYAALGPKAFILAHSRDDGLVPWDQAETMEATLGSLPELEEKTHFIELQGTHNDIWRNGMALATAFTETLALLKAQS
ncbi:kynurenine formamidase [Colletotrichum spaethianum]|uniref:Kynurenine formamidase n=1 Tax=Colletotrichum spaethianum TaxID=700344 RepID=A0AA37P6C9_9PEZI|nr:kynurenine formamidase [Colletotrichum spaethianum]GKT46101.1 kynurenine formamidase [Colletotrichum spaethianum]